MRRKFRGVLHGLLWAYVLRQVLSSDNLQRTSHSWIDFSAMEWQNCRKGKAIHHNRADQNPHQRWSDLQWKSALHHPSDRGRDQLFSRASGAAALDAICTHSAEIGFCHEFEPDLSRVCHFLWSSRLKSAVALGTADVLLRTAEPTVSQFFTWNQCYYPYSVWGVYQRERIY